MSGRRKTTVVYVTGSRFKQEENQVFVETCALDDGTSINSLVDFQFREKPVLQILEVDIRKMVTEGVAKAYSEIRVPCIVEYAGLVFEKYLEMNYPGGLTKAMWNALGDQFLAETNSAGIRVIARAVIGYCDGKQIYTFDGETNGKLSDWPRGDRKFYWDTVFVPDESPGVEGTMTYAEMVEAPGLGLRHKMQKFSQSAKAMRKLVDFLRGRTENGLWM